MGKKITVKFHGFTERTITQAIRFLKGSRSPEVFQRFYQLVRQRGDREGWTFSKNDGTPKFELPVKAAFFSMKQLANQSLPLLLYKKYYQMMGIILAALFVYYLVRRNPSLENGLSIPIKESSNILRLSFFIDKSRKSKIFSFSKVSPEDIPGFIWVSHIGKPWVSWLYLWWFEK